MVGGSGEKRSMGKAHNAPHKKKKKQKGKAVPLVAPPKPKKPEEKQKHLQSGDKKSSPNKSNDSPFFSSTTDSLECIKSYHTLNKRLEQNARDESLTAVQRQLNSEKIEKEQEAMGGIERYQQASMYGAKFNKFNCAHWVEPLLRENFSGKQGGDRPRILDVGAIDNQYLSYDWFDAVAIDLNSQHPSVIKADFFDYAHAHILQAQGETKPFDALILSLVLNFQGDPRRRGDMLALAADERLLTLTGLLFLALPSASLDNSRYCDEEYLILICKTLCLEVVERKRSAKLTLLTFRRTGTFQAYNAQRKTFNYGKKEMGRSPAKPGKQRNNFAVMLKKSTVPR
jgi:hypothetical protein